jgi:iron-sulfur cluster assembly protein
MRFTQKAVDYIKSIQPQGEILRVKVVGGGCSGLSYAMEFTNQGSSDDMTSIQDGLQYVIDKKSSLFLKDVEVDYITGLNGTGFTFKNPAAKQSCGCGSSFST